MDDVGERPSAVPSPRETVVAVGARVQPIVRLAVRLSGPWLSVYS